MSRFTKTELDDFSRRRGITLKWLHETIKRLNKLEHKINSASRLEDVRGAVIAISDEVNSCNIHDILSRAESELKE